MPSSTYIIVITGGESGIGAALARAFGEAGHAVVICGLRNGHLAEVAETDRRIIPYLCDVAEEEAVIAFSKYVGTNFDRVDVLINCAAIYGAIGRFDKTDSRLWKKTYEINLFGVYLVTKHFLPHLLRSSVRKIINFAGGGAFNALPNYSAYAVSKAAVVRFSETIATEFGDLGVHVNCVAPGFVVTDIHNATLEAGEEGAGEGYKFTVEKLKQGSVPMERVVDCVKFLISPEAGALTGKTISVSFDKWDTDVFRQSIADIAKSDLYTLRRVNPR